MRDRVLLAVMGSPDARQIDGIGGADSLTSKVAIVGPSIEPDVDVDYLFAQVAIDRPIVDTEPSCGNMLAGVGPFAVERGLVRAGDPETAVTIHNVNTNARIRAVVQTPGGQVSYDGDQKIDGVPGSAAPVRLEFIDIVGAKCGSMLPTGTFQRNHRRSCRYVYRRCDADGHDRGSGLRAYWLRNRCVGGRQRAHDKSRTDQTGGRPPHGARGRPATRVVPKVSLLARPRSGGLISSRYFTPDTLHAAHAVTGGICVAACALTPGTVANSLANPDVLRDGRYVIEHPSGLLEISLTTADEGRAITIESAGVVRTARKIFEGDVLVPASVWP